MTGTLNVRSGCSFWHEGGRGKNRWVIGWRFGTIREIPATGDRAGFVRVEIPVFGKSGELVWVPAHDVNEPGDTTYHGPKTGEIWKARVTTKKAEQAKADKMKAKGRRFHR